jgi:hypothetical protein
MVGIPKKESPQVQRARKKLQGILEAEKKQRTPERLQEATKNILHYINRNAQERKPLEDRSIQIFDGNKHPAKTQSNYVNTLLEKLRTESGSSQTLKGRIVQQ